MSDLISREEALERLEILKKINTAKIVQDFINAAEQQINNCKTVFDKEKVIEELIELRWKEYEDSDKDLEMLDAEEIYDEGCSQGRFEAYHKAIEIVDKGGIG